MEAITFTLSGETGFFKKPDVNTYQYFTYGHIHKVALLGILGSILGLKGYHQQKKSDDFPEFYEKLKDLKISVCPLNKEGYIPKKVQIFNNSVGYASKEEGGNLIIKEQWLEKPQWKIYILLDKTSEKDLLQELKERLLKSSFVFLPYLGKNDHFATINHIDFLELKEKEWTSPMVIHSLFPKKEGTLVFKKGFSPKREPDFKYEEQLPISLDPHCNLYQCTTMIYSNIPVSSFSPSKIYTTGEKNLIFY